jgi:hypothetical protein
MCPIRRAGKTRGRWKWFKDININSDDFETIGHGFEKKALP